MNIYRKLPSIFTGLGIAGLVTSGVLIAKETPKAIEVYKKFHETDNEGETSVGTVLETVKVYAPAIIVGATSILFILGGNYILKKELKDLTELYNLTAKNYSKSELLKDIPALKEATAFGVAKVLDNDKEEKWFVLHCDQLDHGGVRFKATWKEVMTAAAKVEDKISYHGFVSLTEYLDLLPIDIDTSHIPDYLGWDIGELFEGYECPFVPFEYDDNEDGSPIGIYFPIEPSINNEMMF